MQQNTGADPGSRDERLRRAFAAIGSEAARPDAPSAAIAGPDPNVLHRRRRARLGIGGLLAAAALVVGVLMIGTNPEDGPESSGPVESGDLKGPSTEEWIACTELIAVGDVEAVRPGSREGRLTVTFTVQEWIKPATGGKRIRLDVVDPRVDGVQDPWEAGQHLLIMVPRKTDLVVETFENRRLTFFRPLIAEALEGSRTVSCPPGWWAPPTQGR